MPYAVNGDIKIHYIVEGEGPPLLIHHGLSGYVGSWREAGYIKALKEHYQLILPDVRGHGKSSKPHRPEYYVMEKMVGDVTAVLDDLGHEKALYWGYSLGGRVGLATGKYAPNRFNALVIGGMGLDELDSEASVNRRRGMIDYFGMGNDAIIKDMEKTSGKPLTDQGRIHFSELDVDAIIAISRNNEHLGFEEFLPGVKTPTLLYCGEKDYYYSGAKRCAEIMPNATLVSLPGLDHGAAFDRVDLVLPHVLGFLERIG